MPTSAATKQSRKTDGRCITGCGAPAVAHRNKCVKHLKEDSDRVLRRYKRNAALVRAAKDKPCTDCGIKYPVEIMDLDHVRGVKLFPVSHICSKSTDKIITEITKCDARCPLCHRIRHYNLEHPDTPVTNPIARSR